MDEKKDETVENNEGTENTDIIYVRKKRRWAYIIMLIVLILLVIILNLNIKDVTVMGVRRYTATEACNMVFSSYLDKNLVFCFIKDKMGRKKELPFIDDYKINILGPDSCELIIYEKAPIGALKYMESYMYFDKDGMVTESNDSLLSGVPIIEGLSYGHIVIGEKIPIDNEVLFDEIMNVSQLLEECKIDCESIKFDKAGDITISVNGGALKVKLGDNTFLAAKISALKDMLPKINERWIKGTLDLSDYDDSKEGQNTTLKIEENAEH